MTRSSSAGPVRLLALAGALAWAAAPAASALAPSRSRLSFRADARVDLVGAVARLAGDGGSPSRLETALGREGAARLNGFREHPAVKGLRRLAAAGFSGRFPLQYCLYLSTSPDLTETGPVPDLFVRAAGGAAALEAWRADLASFGRETGFWDWRAGKTAEFEALADAARLAADRDLEADLAGFLGMRPWDEVQVVASPFLIPDRGAWWVIETSSRQVPVAMIGPRGGRLPFGESQSLADDIWIEPLAAAGYLAVEACGDRVAWAPDLCAGIPDAGSPEDCAHRLWSEAALTLLHERAFGQPRAATDVRRARAMRRYPAALAALREFTARREGDWLSWAPRLLAPFTRDGYPPSCPMPDPSRAQNPRYRLRMEAAARGRLQTR